MGDAAAIFEKAKDILLVDKVIAKLTGYLDLIPDALKQFYYENRAACLIAAICLLVLFAFEGYKIFKMGLYAISAGVLGYLGYSLLGPMLAPALQQAGLPEFIDGAALIAVVLAIIAVILTRFANQFIIMLLGGAFGYLVGSVYVWRVLRDYFTTLEFIRNDMTKYIVGGVFAAIFVLLFVLLFKHAFIIGSSFGSLAFAGWLLQKLIVPGASKEMIFCFILVGAAIGIVATIYQYKQDEDFSDYSFKY